MVWEQIGARDGGTVAGFAVITQREGDALVFAATPMGVLHSEDGGQHWVQPVSVTGVPFATAVAASPGFIDDGALFVTSPNGLYRSRDRGLAWERVLVGGLIAVAISPNFAHDHTLFVAAAEDGVLLSSDGGSRWSGMNAGLLDLDVLTLTLSPCFADDRTAFAGTATGLYRSRNGGRSWRAVDIGFEDVEVQALAVSPNFARDRLVLAGTATHGLLRSTDGGASWDPTLPMAERGVAALALALGDNGAVRVAAVTEADDSVFVSDDGCDHWRETAQLPAPALTVALVSRTAGSRYLSVLVGMAGHGVARLADDDHAWELANDGLRATPLSLLAASPNYVRDHTLFIASSDGLVLATRNGGADWSEWDVVLDEPSIAALTISPEFATDHTVWVLGVDGVYRSDDGSVSWQRLPPQLEASSVVSVQSALDESLIRFNALAVAPGDRGRSPVLFAVGDAAEVFRSDDRGDSWRSLGRVAAGGDLVSIVVSPEFTTDRTVFAVTSGAAGPEGEPGLTLWRSMDGGALWHRWLDAPGASHLPVAIPPSHWRDGSLFVGNGRQVLKSAPNTREQRGDVSHPLWRATDLGPDIAAIVALATPTGDTLARTVFAATNAGIYVSRDDGQTFATWSEALDIAGVVALAVSADTTSALVFAVGFGGTIWRRRID